jgi:lysylphosphatidylglycerol synthetase-like protein (DUF2156 family)
VASDRILFRTAGAAAGAGALLRLATAVPGAFRGEEPSERAYLCVDLLTLLSLFALFASQDRLRRGIGPWGFGISMLGLVLIRTGTRIGAFSTYDFGAAVLALGLALMGAVMIRSGRWARATGAAWIASLVVGLLGAVLHARAGFLVASLLFALGLGLAACLLLKHEPRAAA